MKPKINGRVRAQRKFAQGAIIPSTGSSAPAERRDRPSERTSEPILQVSKQQATNLLDLVAFKNIHNHYAGLREVRVVLDRLPHNEDPSPHTPTRFSAPKARAPQRKRQKRTHEMEQVIKKSRLSLRSRSISRDVAPQKTNKYRKLIRAATPHEDNQPLQNFIKKKFKKITHKVKKTIKKKTRSKPVEKPSTSSKHVVNNVISTTKTNNNNADPGPTAELSSERGEGSKDESMAATITPYTPTEHTVAIVTVPNDVVTEIMEPETSQNNRQSVSSESTVTPALKYDEDSNDATVTLEPLLSRVSPSVDIISLTDNNTGDEPQDMDDENLDAGISESILDVEPEETINENDRSKHSTPMREVPMAVPLSMNGPEPSTSVSIPDTSPGDVYEFRDDGNAHVPAPYRPTRNDSMDILEVNGDNVIVVSVETQETQSISSEGSSRSPEAAVGNADVPLSVEHQGNDPRRNDANKTPQANGASSRISNKSSMPQGTVKEGKRFTPTPFEAENLIQYATKIKLQNPLMGICSIKLTETFKPPLITNEEGPPMKTSTQYINKMFERWSPATRELLIIKCTQNQKIRSSPLFDGVELDLVNLYKYVQERGGLRTFQANDSSSWTEILNKLRISSKGQPHKKLETLYFKYLLHYETMTYLEREDIHKKVAQCWEEIHKKHLERALRPLWRQECLMKLDPYNDDAPTDDIVKACIENDDCVAQNNRLCTLKQFRKIAERVKTVYLSDKPVHTVTEIEQEYWRVVMLGTEHVSVNIASVDTSEHGHGFPADESAPYGDHPWNLKRVCRSRDNVLSFLPYTVGISAPSLHYGMVFTTSCWHMDPHMLPWIEYLHEGPPKIWYSVPESQSSNFRAAVSDLCPTAVQNKSIWLPSDITMIPPKLLQQHNVSLERIVQHPGEFVIVYPNTYSASIDTGMTISEGTYYAPHSWLQNIEHIFKELRDNCEPSMFPMEQLLIGVARSEECPAHVLTQTHNALQPLIAAELRHRAAAAQYGLKMLTPLQEAASGKRLRYKSNNNECFYCRCTIHLSKVIGLTESGTSMCLEHGLRLFDTMNKKKMAETEKAYCVLLYTSEELQQIVTALQKRITSWAQT